MFGLPPKLALPVTMGLDYRHQLWEHMDVIHELARDHQDTAMARQNRA